jgi:cysteine desulfurase/selenocysteine lyase
MLNLAKLRADTPGAATLAHFNNAGSSLMPAPVRQALVDHLDLECRLGGYEAAAATSAVQDGFYASAARLIGARPEEIAYVDNATRAWVMAFYSLPFGPGDRILTAQSEYAANVIAFLQVAKRSGAVVEVIPNDATGALDVSALERMMDARVKLIAITHVPTNGGLVNPAAEIGAVAAKHGVPYLLDACQSVGQMPLDVTEIGCTMLSATGRKYLRGPRGTGFLYVRKDWADRMEPPTLDLHSASWVARDRYELQPGARRFEVWERSVADLIGLKTAIDYALEIGLAPAYARILTLADAMRRRLGEIPGVTVTDLGANPCGIVSFTKAGRDPDAVKAALQAQAVNVSVTRVSSTRFDMEARGLTAMVRSSAHYYNNEEDIDRLIAAVAAA